MQLWYLSIVLTTAITLCAAGALAAAQHREPTVAALGDQEKSSSEKSSMQPSMPPSKVVSVGPLGFAPPSLHYLGSRLSQVSLDFLDEDHLLFTFRVPGLIARERPASGETPGMERHIRALVIDVSSGSVTAEAIWALHDYDRYIWTIQGNRFLLRDRNTIQIGDVSLHLTPYLRFPGPVNYLELDPERRLLVTDTSERVATDFASGDTSGSTSSSASASTPGRPSTAASSVVADHNPAKPASTAGEADEANLQQRILRVMGLDSRTVMLFSRITGVVHLPIDGEGYYEVLRGSGLNWMINYRGFRGSTTLVTQISSTCTPVLDVVATGIFLASTCSGNGYRITAISREQHHMWDMAVPATTVWPILVKSPESRRIARAVLDVSTPIALNNPLSAEDLRGQTVKIYDLATGKVQLTAPVWPILDGGGNFALSPSGNRVAVLNGGAIQIFNLPPAPALQPTTASRH